MDDIQKIVCEDIFLDEDGTDTKHYKTGYNLLGPIFSLFIDWIYSFAIENEIKDIFFMLREGELYYNLFNKNIKLYEDKSITSHLLFISRFSLWSNTINNEDDFKQFVTPYFGKLKATKLIDWFDLPFDKQNYEFVLTDDNFDLVRETFFGHILEKSKKGYDNLRLYLNNTFNNVKKCIIVNVGYGMTNQYYLSKLLPNIDMIGLYICTHTNNKYKYDTSDLLSEGFLVNKDDRHYILDLFLKHNCWIEQSCMGPKYKYSTYSYDKEGNPIFGTDSKSSINHFDKVSIIQDGINDFQKEWLKVKKQNNISDQYMKKDIYKIKEYLYNILLKFCFNDQKIRHFDNFNFTCIAGKPTFCTGNPYRDWILANRLMVKPPRMIIFLCTANYYRSRFAEMYFNKWASISYVNWFSISRALDYEKGLRNNKGNISRHTIKFIEENSSKTTFDFTKSDIEREPLPITKNDMERCDIIVAVCKKEHEPIITEQFPEYRDKVEYWDIDDVRPGKNYHPLKEIMANVQKLIMCSLPK